MSTSLYEQFRAVQTAGIRLADIPSETIDNMLLQLADDLVGHTDLLLAENAKDLQRMSPDNPKYDRLKLTAERIASIASDMRNVASLSSPVGDIMETAVRPNGMLIEKVCVPFGVIGVIYEARPNVTPDVFSLCVKTGNACILKGGSDAACSNEAIVAIVKDCLRRFGIDENTAMLMPNDREATAQLLEATGLVDLIIPRGSRQLIDFVRSHAKVPVIETGAGICHCYFDRSGDLTKGAAIVNNAKTRRVSVCNALDCLIVHRDRLTDLPELCRQLALSNVIIYADEEAYGALEGKYPARLLEKAGPEHFGTEFLDYKMSVRTVPAIDDALEHIRQHSSRHSESIVAEDPQALQIFRRSVDAACVYLNLPTAFTDGAQFGFGAEIGISTQKLHARGPMALREITTYKYVVSGNGQVRK